MSQGNPPPNSGQPQRIHRTASRQYDNQPPSQDYQQYSYPDNAQIQNQDLQYYDHRKPYQSQNTQPEKINAKKRVKKPIIIACISVIAIGIVAAGIVLLIDASNSKSPGMKAFEEAADKFVQECNDFNDLVSQMEPNILDVNNLISSTGKTLGELQSAIDEKEAAINIILTSALEGHRVPRQDELDEIAQYNADIVSLCEEKIDMYRDVELAKLRQIQLDEGNLTAEQIAQYNVDIKEAFDQANNVSEDIYLIRLATIENIYKAMGEVGSATHLDEQQAAKTSYEEQLAKNKLYYIDALESLTISSGVLVGVEPKKTQP